jgi:hypothetical protein
MRGGLQAALWLALAALATVHFRDDRVGRTRAEAFAREWGFDVRKPAYLEQVQLEPSADLASGAMAEAAVADEIGRVRWSELDAREREAWMEALARRDEMLGAAHALALSAVAANPGFPFHAYRAGQLAYLSDRRRGAESLKRDRARWLQPLRLTTRRAPGFDAGWSFLAGAMVEAWPLLTDDERVEGRRVIRRAFLDPAMARQAFGAVAAELGTDGASALVPDLPGPLAAVGRQVAETGDVTAAAAIRWRWEAAERRAREADLARLELRARMGDADGLRAGCRAFVSAHSPLEMDGPAGRRQAARLLELWPPDTAGSWRNDGRAALLRYVLDGRHESMSGEAVARAAASLTGVPDPERARLALLAGDRYGWEGVLRESKTLGSLEWTSFLTELARAELAGGRHQAAREALERIAPSARGECEALLVRREIAEAEGDEAEAAQADQRLAELRMPGPGVAPSSSLTSLSLCVDPRADSGQVLRLELVAPAPALIGWEVNGGRRGSVVVSGSALLDVPFDGLQGRVVVSVTSLAGPRPVLISASRKAATEAPVTSASVTEIAGTERSNSTRP